MGKSNTFKNTNCASKILPLCFWGRRRSGRHFSQGKMWAHMYKQSLSLLLTFAIFSPIAATLDSLNPANEGSSTPPRPRHRPWKAACPWDRASHNPDCPLPWLSTRLPLTYATLKGCKGHTLETQTPQSSGLQPSPGPKKGWDWAGRAGSTGMEIPLS